MFAKSIKKTRKLSSRFVLLFSAVTLPLLIILFAVGHYAQDVVLTQVANSYQNLVNSNLNMIDRSLDDITTNMVYNVDHDENFQKFGQTGLSDSEYYFAQMELIQRNSAYRSYYHTVDMFYVYSVPNQVLATTNVITDTDHDQVSSWITETLNSPEALRPLMYQWTIVQIGQEYYLHRVVSDDTSNNAYIGALISMNTLKLPLKDVRTGGDVLFAGNDGMILSKPSDSLSKDFRLPADKLAQNTSFSYSDGGRKLFIITSQSPLSGISMAVVLPYSDLLKGLKQFQTVINLLPLFALVILLIYLFVFRRIILTPILQLLGTIRRVKDGDMEMKLPESPITEFDIINHTFNNMMDEIKDLKIDVYEERLNAQKAELKHLQTQINPHFFLNTMNIIFQLADLKRYELVKKTVRHMVGYFRFMLGTSRDTITLSQELEHIRNYLEIQKMRYQDSFDFEIGCAEELLDARIPSLLVQPFVENAMLHGMSVKGEPFLLQITAARAEDSAERMLIEVKDNGKGMSPELMEELASDQYKPASDDNHIGIWNVKKRAAMRYASLARISFQPNDPKGLAVRLLLPIDLTKEQDEHGADAGR
ncbi:two-component system, sensor histidine kinase YesM [Paenibacillus catalpae]|uniref:Two-component system, sensor histidine kinase YesM n=1 Tax=Paenibacillus catalpae TaxID=1045775 RepID=A0A1I1XU34_9BACL|nr:histidine kinase [Paenibacillus catalpae]SFE10699.1 two-component system, sensor histidine kinase YesM [Paenibacillus catalpae]